MSVIPRKWCPHKVRCDSKSARRTKNTTRSKFTTRTILSTAGSFGHSMTHARLILHKNKPTAGWLRDPARLLEGGVFGLLAQNRKILDLSSPRKEGKLLQK